MTLMLHAGATEITREVVAEVLTPAATETWQPIPHITVVNNVLGAFSNSGFAVSKERHGLWRDGLRYFGTFDIATNDGTRGFSIGIRNSNDKSFPAGCAIGERVFVCDNLAFVGEIQFGRRHTTNIMRDLPARISDIIAKFIKFKGLAANRWLAYEDTTVGDAKVHDLLIRSVDENIIPLRTVASVLEQWRSPKHDAFRPRTINSLFNAYTEALKGTSEWELPTRTTRLYGMMDRVVGYQPAVLVEA